MASKIKRFLPLGIVLFLVYVACRFWPTALAFLSLEVDAVVPFIIGSAIAYAVNILIFYERHYFTRRQSGLAAKSRRPVCMIGAYVTVVVVLTAVIWIVVPEFISCIQTLIQQAPEAVQQLLEYPLIAENLPDELNAYISGIDWEQQIPQLI